MKVLSIRQPWADLIASGVKDIENRDWPTKFRGQFLVHASKQFDKESLRYIQNQYGLLLTKTKEDFPMGGIVGKSEIIDCVTSHPSEWFFGKYGFVLRNSKMVKFLPYKGQLGFFDLKTQIDIEVKRGS